MAGKPYIRLVTDNDDLAALQLAAARRAAAADDASDAMIRAAAAALALYTCGHNPETPGPLAGRLSRLALHIHAELGECDALRDGAA